MITFLITYTNGTQKTVNLSINTYLGDIALFVDPAFGIYTAEILRVLYKPARV